jgi:hypothetical protein
MPNEPYLSVAAYLIAGTFVLLLLSAIWKRREAIVFFLRRLLLIEITYLGVAIIASRVFKQPGLVSLLLGIIAGLVLINRLPSRRKRHIRASVKRKVIERYERRTGEKFDSRAHELDHTVPFSKGGSHTADNLQVMEQTRNRSKGATNPWWDLFGRG